MPSLLPLFLLPLSPLYPSLPSFFLPSLSVPGTESPFPLFVHPYIHTHIGTYAFLHPSLVIYPSSPPPPPPSLCLSPSSLPSLSPFLPSFPLSLSLEGYRVPVFVLPPALTQDWTWTSTWLPCHRMTRISTCHRMLWPQFILHKNLSWKTLRYWLCDVFCVKVVSTMYVLVSYVNNSRVITDKRARVNYERGRRPSEFSLNMRIFSSWATRPTVTLFSVLYLLNQATDSQTVFGIWKPHSINHSY